jgi:hypothetical protein
MVIQGGLTIQNTDLPSYGGLKLVFENGTRKSLYEGQLYSVPWSEGGVAFVYVPVFETQGYVSKIKYFVAGKEVSNTWLANDARGTVEIRAVVTWSTCEGCDVLRRDEHSAKVNLYANSICPPW